MLFSINALRITLLSMDKTTLIYRKSSKVELLAAFTQQSLKLHPLPIHHAHIHTLISRRSYQ